jgi:two-component sensor histidine kinase
MLDAAHLQEEDVHFRARRGGHDRGSHFSDPGDGPAAGHTNAGLGTTIVESLCQQINATVDKERLAEGYTISIKIPHRKAS